MISFIMIYRLGSAAKVCEKRSSAVVTWTGRHSSFHKVEEQSSSFSLSAKRSTFYKFQLRKVHYLCQNLWWNLITISKSSTSSFYGNMLVLTVLVHIVAASARKGTKFVSIEGLSREKNMKKLFKIVSVSGVCDNTKTENSLHFLEGSDKNLLVQQQK